MAASMTHKHCRRGASPIGGPTLESTCIVPQIDPIRQNNKKKKKCIYLVLQKEPPVIHWLGRTRGWDSLFSKTCFINTRTCVYKGFINNLKIYTILWFWIKETKIASNDNVGLVNWRFKNYNQIMVKNQMDMVWIAVPRKRTKDWESK